MNLFETKSYEALEDIARVLIDNGVEYVRTTDTNNIYGIHDELLGHSIGLVKPAPAMELLYEALELGDDEDIPDEYLSDDMIDWLTDTAEPEQPEPEPVIHTPESIISKLDQIIGNTLELTAPIEPQRADTLLKLAQLRSMFEGK